jgi:hypothetical protein
VPRDRGLGCGLGLTLGEVGCGGEHLPLPGLTTSPPTSSAPATVLGASVHDPMDLCPNPILPHAQGNRLREAESLVQSPRAASTGRGPSLLPPSTLPGPHIAQSGDDSGGRHFKWTQGSRKEA